MSSIAITGGATGTGVFSLLAPSTSTNRTLTLPDATGTVLTSATTTGFPAGSVLQVVQGVLSAQTAQTSSTMTNIFSASITPSSSTSKVLIICTVPVYVGSSAGLYATLRRGATDLSSNNLSRGFFQQSLTANWTGSSGITYLDSPATTSSTTYYFAAANATGSGIIYVGQDGTGNCGQIVLLEIAA